MPPHQGGMRAFGHHRIAQILFPVGKSQVELRDHRRHFKFRLAERLSCLSRNQNRELGRSILERLATFLQAFPPFLQRKSSPPTKGRLRFFNSRLDGTGMRLRKNKRQIPWGRILPRSRVRAHVQMFAPHCSNLNAIPQKREEGVRDTGFEPVTSCV